MSQKYISIIRRDNRFVMGHEEIRFVNPDGSLEEFVYRAHRFSTREEAMEAAKIALPENGGWKAEVVRYG